MKKLNGNISYEWWRDDGKEIKPSHILALDESALNRIHEMRNEGFTSGELLDNITMDEEDGEDGISYSGWWNTKIETK